MNQLYESSRAVTRLTVYCRAHMVFFDRQIHTTQFDPQILIFTEDQSYAVPLKAFRRLEQIVWFSKLWVQGELHGQH
jgi:hypothetical protein